MTIEDVVRGRGPMTVAAFMDLALYHPQLGYYARAAQRSGRAGDFFTSVDVGPIFGELLAVQIAEMFDATGSHDLVEAGAGNGRLSADILRSLRDRRPDLYARTRLHLVEASPAARAAQPATLGDVAERLSGSSDAIPARFEGVLLANELLDAFPVHQVVMTEHGLREVYVEPRGGRLALTEGALSTPELARYFERIGIALRPGWRAEVNLRALDWVAAVAHRLTCGFAIAIDYGHEARDLYSSSHAAGTLTTFARHRAGFPTSTDDRPAWLQEPGERDLTAHVDFTSVRAAAQAAGLDTIALLDQTYFLLGLMNAAGSGLEGPAATAAELKRRLALKTLLMPGGLGSTHKVLVLAKGAGHPQLAGCSYRVRMT